MEEPKWVTIDAALLLHEYQIAEFGGSAGVRDTGLLDSALTRPVNLFLYEQPVPLSRLAGSYCFGISRNHPFIDGNKRVDYVVARTFLLKNGHDIRASYDKKLKVMMALAGGELSESEVAAWFSECTVQVD